MNKQISLSVLNDELLQVRTTKKEFPEKIERIIPFDEWIGIIEPYYYKGERGNKPYDLEAWVLSKILCKSKTNKAKDGMQGKQVLRFPLNSQTSAG